MTTIESETTNQMMKKLSISSNDNEMPQSETEHLDLDDDEIIAGIKFVNYRDESQIDSVMTLVGRDLSEPYSGAFVGFSLLTSRCDAKE